VNQELHSQICLSLRAFDVTKGGSDVSKSNLSHAYSMHCRHSSNCRVVCGFDLAKQDVRQTSGDVACLTHKFIHNRRPWYVRPFDRRRSVNMARVHCQLRSDFNWFNSHCRLYDAR